MAPSFASGRVLADASRWLISQAYFNPLVIPLFHALVSSNDTTTPVVGHPAAQNSRGIFDANPALN